jgi:hypothetical protein
MDAAKPIHQTHDQHGHPWSRPRSFFGRWGPVGRYAPQAVRLACQVSSSEAFIRFVRIGMVGRPSPLGSCRSRGLICDRNLKEARLDVRVAQARAAGWLASRVKVHARMVPRPPDPHPPSPPPTAAPSCRPKRAAGDALGSPARAHAAGGRGGRSRLTRASCGRSSEAEHELPKLATRVRFPSPAPLEAAGRRVLSVTAGPSGGLACPCHSRATNAVGVGVPGDRQEPDAAAGRGGSTSPPRPRRRVRWSRAGRSAPPAA